MWDTIGQLQFDMLRSKGLRPEHHLYDIACGALRLGVKAIPYLETGRYHGLEKEPDLIKAALEHELAPELRERKRPELVISSSFEFEKFSADPDFAIAQSLFTHLTPDLINLCFAKLRPRMKRDSVFYATFVKPAPGLRNPKKSHARLGFFYEEQEMLAFGTRNGFSGHYIGDWNHPRGQVLVEYRAAS
ncbi:MAG: class I SAM-dependent methyltransferase [Pseudomonadota bacterium]|nr:class I SAM-dependent methyltransferase [Pseudomonadota bacterium]